ncbi:hydroxysqualene dehydroxylase HpnE [Thermogutta sp.]|uniref:hydroxysqualene dehydroxylase HpnE n=1 Tax=Thermogutta sp. TaxID=1962930 RepID=UPI00322013C9
MDRRVEPERLRVAIVGGGLAGLATAWFLRNTDCEITLFEARRVLGGRVRSVRDPEIGQTVDTCQHVALGCCTEFLRFCREMHALDLFIRHRTLFFADYSGKICRFQAVRGLPAPFHLLPSVFRFSLVSPAERLALLRASWTLWKEGGKRSQQCRAEMTQPFLRRTGQSEKLVRIFWSPLLVSATSETLDRIPLSLTRMIVREVFIKNREGHELWIPRVPLSVMCDVHFRRRLEGVGVRIISGRSVRGISRCNNTWCLHFADGQTENFAAVVLAVPWWVAARLLPTELVNKILPNWPTSRSRASPEACAITGVHLWFDRPGFSVPHAVLPYALSQWVFRPPFAETLRTESVNTSGDSHFAASPWYCHVVISASHRLTLGPPEECRDRVVRELQQTFAPLRSAKLLASRVITEPAAVLSPHPDWDDRRPPQDTGVPGLVLAGDWTATGWPGTMESAIRSARLASTVVSKFLQAQPFR